jgi:hypothetical protein
VAKIATVIEEYTTEKQRLLCAPLWANGLNAKYIHEEIFSIYGGKCLSHKAVHNWMTKVMLMTKSLKRRCRSC